MNMMNIADYGLDKDKAIEMICDFFKMDIPKLNSVSVNDSIKELCVIRLCRAVGLTGKINHKSGFFQFFASIMGEAVCEKLKIKTHVACDELRLVKYEHINLVNKTKQFLDTESVEEAFLDAFELADRFKYLVPKLKKV